jgi:DNA transposition AAA+ family ATPase
MTQETNQGETLVLPPDRTHINLSGDVVTVATAAIPDETQRMLVRWSFDFAKSNDWDWKEASAQFKISTTVLFRVWSGKYINPKTGQPVALDGFCESVARFKALAEQRNAALTRLPFVETSTWRKIDHICTEALVSNTIAFIFGDSQVGKTRCLKEHARRNNHGQTAFVDTPGDGVQGLCMDIARALHIGTSSFDKTFRRIVTALGPNKLLILDDVHVIFECYQKTSIARCLTLIRKIHDRSGCGLVISATDVFATDAAKSEFRNTMKQFFRRGPLTLQLGTQPPWEDVVRIVEHYQLPAPKGGVEETLRTLARHDGLGKITKFLAGAARSAAKKRQPFAWNHFERYYDITKRMAQPIADGSEAGRAVGSAPRAAGAAPVSDARRAVWNAGGSGK